MSNADQISLFDFQVNSSTEKVPAIEQPESAIETQIIPHEIEDHVQVIIPLHKQEDPEAYFYLVDFIKKRGIVLVVTEKPFLQYQVEVGNKVAYVYHDELAIGWPIQKGVSKNR